MPAKKPIEIHGVLYLSMTDAARSLGLSSGAIRSANKRGTLHKVGTGEFGRTKKPVTIRGIAYASQAEAARALGLTKMSISNAMKTDRLETVGLGHPSKW